MELQFLSSQSKPILGILELDEGPTAESPTFAPREGSLFHPATFNRPVITKIVEGALADVIIPGDASLESACVAAAEQLVARGAGVITADCGFLSVTRMRSQRPSMCRL